MTIATTNARVEHINPLTDRVTEIILTPDNYIDYQAGQYLQIQCAQEFLSYSIANAPLGSHKYELHIRHEKGNLYNKLLFDTIKQEAALTIRLPLGDCHLSQIKANQPIIFIAAGTGFAPIKAMIEQLLTTDDVRAFELYWGARSQSDLYMDDKARQWHTHVSHFRYFSLLSAITKETLTSMVINQHQHDLQNHQIIIGGPFDMVYATRDMLVASGISPAQIYSDAFSFEEGS